MDRIFKMDDSIMDIHKKDGFTLEQAKKFIYEYDLTSIFRRLVNIDKWSKKSAHAAIKQYRNYLYLKKKYGSTYLLPPSYEIDEVWHAHILHTEQYIEFCNQLFGCYFHHQPSLDLDLQAQSNSFTETQELYNQEFGEYIYAIKKNSLKDLLLSFLYKPTLKEVQ